MAYEPLHHKYRPQTFAQLVGQGAIATTLSNALQQNRIAPAYLFCGPRGTGKTSSARILAKSLNCLSSDSPTSTPCGTCQVCREITVGASLDIIEIDAASNTGVDNIRELIERAQFAPVQCRHKLYVLDEVHMLSTAAFNALLKTLEEPPPHVVFVLATTDPQRVLPTIISRCQRFDFRRIPLDAMVQHLTYIAQRESIAISPDALQLVAQLSQGGLRDAESLLDQLGLLDGEITIEAVWDLVGAVSERELLALVQAIGADDGAQVIILARQLMDRGREPLMVLQSLVAFYRDLLIAKTAGERRDLVAITPSIWTEMVAFAQSLSLPLLLSSQQHLRATEVQVKNTTQPRLWLEITLMGLLPSALGQASVTAPKLSVPPPNVAAAIPANPPVTPSAPRPDTSSPTRVAQVSPTVDIADTQVSTGKVDDAETADDVETTDLEINRIEDDAKSAAVSAPAPAPSNDAPAMGSLSDIWGKIVAQLEPFGTKVLMRQQAQLITCDGVEATVGIRSQPLMRMAQERLSNVEIAFEKVFGHKIRVTMVVTTSESSTGSKESDETPLPSAPPSTFPAAAKPVITADPPSDPTISAAKPLNVDSSEPPPHAQPSAQNNPPPMAKWQESSELDRSVKSFAQFFNGQIVNLDDEGTDTPKPSTEPGPDVPF